eukprot:7809396-Pyramimonas_sp.AAC.1
MWEALAARMRELAVLKGTTEAASGRSGGCQYHHVLERATRTTGARQGRRQGHGDRQARGHQSVA